MDSQIPDAIHLGAEAAVRVAERMAAVDARLDAMSPAERAAAAERQQAEGVNALKGVSARPPRKVPTAGAVPA